MIEFADGNRTEVIKLELIRACGRYSAQEVRAILSRRVPGLPDLADIRQLGAPDSLFEKMLEQRARKMGFGQENRTLPAPAPVEDTDLQAKMLAGL